MASARSSPSAICQVKSSGWSRCSKHVDGLDGEHVGFADADGAVSDDGQVHTEMGGFCHLVDGVGDGECDADAGGGPVEVAEDGECGPAGYFGADVPVHVAANVGGDEPGDVV